VSGEKSAGQVTITTASSTTTTRPTTTTSAPFDLDGAPDGLTGTVESFYLYAIAETATAPPMPATLLATIEPVEGSRPKGGTASAASFRGEQIAVVEVGRDTFLAVTEAGEWKIVGGAWPSLDLGPYYGTGPRHVAVIGSDARPDEAMDQTRADSIHFIGLSGDGSAGLLGMPRDSYMSVPGMWRMKITNSLALGGVDATMAALREVTGLPLEGYVLTGFSGFESLIDSVLGGVEVEVPFAINDRWAKADLSAGLQILDGFDALAFARARKTVPGGDFARSEHQGVILIGAVKGVRAMGVGSIPALLEAAEPYLMTDLTPEQLLTFSALAIESDLDDLESIVVPGSLGTAGSASVVYLGGGATALFEDLADGKID
jgi:LCP family protein required for cell wall assembly